MASKFVPAAGSDETVDDVLDSKKALRYNEAKELEKARKQAVTENRKWQTLLKNASSVLTIKTSNNSPHSSWYEHISLCSVAHLAD